VPIGIQHYETLRERVYKALREAILNGDLKPGQKLSQEWLSRKMKVSRMPIREAIKKLEIKGLIESIPYKESRVADFSSKDIGEVYSIRALLEGYAVRLATNKVREKDLEELKKINEEMIGLIDQKKYRRLPALNERFHQNIYNRCGNERLCKMIKDLWSSIPKNS
jgi:DNA-binding GntR family transcriptional regulator